MATVEIILWGEKIRLDSDEDSTFIQKVADYLNDKMEEVLKQDSTLITTKIVALRAAFMIAAEYMLLQQEVDKIEFAVEKLEETINLMI